jgi:RNA polymerase sigma factor for flagellar operon FliA
MGITCFELKRVLAESTQSLVSLDGIEEDDQSASIHERLHDPDAPAIDAELNEPEEIVYRLSSAIETLPERDQLVLNHYYREERTLKQIAREIAVSESRVSQIRSRAVEKLSILLRAHEPALAA